MLFANDKSYLDDYRNANPDKVSADVGKLLDAEAKYTVDETVMDYMIEMYCGYYERYLEYVQREKLEVKEIVKEVTNPDGSKSSVKYVENIGIDEYARIYFTDEVAATFMTKAYHKDRAKQFLPYAALRGFEELIENEERTVTPRRELAEDEIESLSRTMSNICRGDRVAVTFYAVDTYFTARGTVSELDSVFRTITVGGRCVSFDDVYGIERC
jgi:hypothetical protein